MHSQTQPAIDIQPLSRKTRQRTFFLLLFIFMMALPFLYLYATGYRFDVKEPTSLVSTGGMYIAVEKAEADIYIDGELVRETRTFRKAFYAQNLDAGTHRVHVQKEGYHTWVKELPVSKRLVTEAEAFNLPLVPHVRIISEWQTATGSMVLREPLTFASSTNEFIATTTTATSSFVRNAEFISLVKNFASTSSKDSGRKTGQFRDLLTIKGATTTDEELATSTVTGGEVKLALQGEDLFASWIGPFEQMPYYYCAPEFERYNPEAKDLALAKKLIAEEIEQNADEPVLEIPVYMHPVQTIPKDAECDPVIRIDRRGQKISDFEFFPGSTDFILVALEDGIYVVEVDDRSWQNVQPLLNGANLRLHIENGSIFVYDGTTIYQILLNID
jgi:hypothetical protein